MIQRRCIPVFGNSNRGGSNSLFVIDITFQVGRGSFLDLDLFVISWSLRHAINCKKGQLLYWPYERWRESGSPTQAQQRGLCDGLESWL